MADMSFSRNVDVTTGMLLRALPYAERPSKTHPSYTYIHLCVRMCVCVCVMVRVHICLFTMCPLALVERLKVVLFSNRAPVMDIVS